MFTCHMHAEDYTNAKCPAWWVSPGKRTHTSRCLGEETEHCQPLRVPSGPLLVITPSKEAVWLDSRGVALLIPPVHLVHWGLHPVCYFGDRLHSFSVVLVSPPIVVFVLTVASYCKMWLRQLVYSFCSLNWAVPGCDWGTALP